MKLLLLGLISSSLALLSTTSFAKESPRLKAAVTDTMAAFKKYGKKVSGLKMECLSFGVEASTSKQVTVSAREVHNQTCGGDPKVAPSVATFQVRGKKVFIDDVVSGETIPFDSTYQGADGP